MLYYICQVRAAYDESGLIFGIMHSSAHSQHSIKLYDIRNYGKGPFQDIAPVAASNSSSAGGSGSGSGKSLSLVESAYYRALFNNSNVGSTHALPARPSSYLSAQIAQYTAKSMLWNEFEFSLDGCHVLINCFHSFSNGDNIMAPAALVVDGFRSDIEPTGLLRGKDGSAHVGNIVSSSSEKSNVAAAVDSVAKLGCSFSVDGKFVLVGNKSNEIVVYEKTNNDDDNLPTVSTKQVAVLTGHTSPVTTIRCNPKYDVVASSSNNNIALWIHCNE